jgi:hypothetical protein
MVKKLIITSALCLVLLSGEFVGVSQAGNLKNGVACGKSGATTTVTIKSEKKTYICIVNPASITNPNVAKGGKTWTLKTCVTYYAAYKSNQQSIDDQRSLVSVMSEPDKTTYTMQLDDSQASLTKVLATIERNYCKTGL